MEGIDRELKGFDWIWKRAQNLWKKYSAHPSHKYDANGRAVFKQKNEILIGTNLVEMDSNHLNLNEGTYFVSVFQKGEILQTEMVLKTNALWPWKFKRIATLWFRIVENRSYQEGRCTDLDNEISKVLNFKKRIRSTWKPSPLFNPWNHPT
jgi:hypothetical protein